jgi:negative regulator of sigma E activity
MNELPQNELLSAYLDGELTADERARVEQLLAADPAARRVVDEFRAVRGRLQALPKHTVGEDLSERVLRAAERRMLGQTAAPTGEVETPAPPELRPWRSLARRFLTRRSLAWAAAAAAVALVLVFDDVGQQPAVREEKLARAPATPAAAPAGPREPPSIRAVPEDLAVKAEPRGLAEGEPSKEKWGRAEAKRAVDVSADKDGAAALDAPAAPTVAKSAAPSAPAPTKPSAGLVAGQPAAKPEAALGYSRGKAGETGWQMEQRARDERFASQMKRTSLAEGEVLIVRCQIRADQTPRQPFQAILASNSIDWEGPPAPSSSAKGDAGQVGLGFGMSEELGDKALPAKKKPASDKKAAETDRLTEMAPAEAKQNEAPGPTAGVEAVLVEATWDQVEGTVAELSKRSDVYTSVALESPPGASVPRSLDQYNRVGGTMGGMPGPGAAEAKPQKAAEDTEAVQAKGTNVDNARRRGIARLLGRMPQPMTPGETPSSSYGPGQERQDARQQAASGGPRGGRSEEAGREVQQPLAPAASPAPGAAGMGGMGVAAQQPAEPPTQQRIAPESLALAAEPRTYRVLFLFETAPQAAAASAPVETQKAAKPAKQ